MVVTADEILLEIIGPHSGQLAQSTSNILVMNDVRDGATPQPRSTLDTNCHRVAHLDAVILHMEQKFETPIRLSKLARSSRSQSEVEPYSAPGAVA